MPRALEELFLLKTKYETNNGLTISLECYVVELYLDQLHDLLYAPDAEKPDKPRLEIVKDPNTNMTKINNIQQC